MKLFHHFNSIALREPQPFVCSLQLAVMLLKRQDHEGDLLLSCPFRYVVKIKFCPYKSIGSICKNST